MSDPIYLYVVYDGRACDGDTDKASILFTSDDLVKTIGEIMVGYLEACVYRYKEVGQELKDELHICNHLVEGELTWLVDRKTLFSIRGNR